MKIKFFIIPSLLLIILSISLSWAQWPVQRGMGHGHGHPPCWLPDDLQLTAEQKEKLISIQGSYLSDISSLRNDLLNKRYELRRLMSDPISKAEDIRAKQEEALSRKRSSIISSWCGRSSPRSNFGFGSPDTKGALGPRGVTGMEWAWDTIETLTQTEGWRKNRREHLTDYPLAPSISPSSACSS
jgi:hypothetical protein